MILEIVAVLFTLTCVYFTIKNNVIAWPIGIVGVSAYLWLFFSINLYAEVITQIVFLGQSFFGWYVWTNLKNKPAAPITRIVDTFKGNLIKVDMIIEIATIVVVTFGCVYAIIMGLFAYGFIGEPSIPLIDSFTTAISLVANYYLAKRFIENWYLWITVDVIYVGVFFYKEVYLTAGLYALFFFMAIQGYRKWKGLYDTQTTVT